MSSQALNRVAVLTSALASASSSTCTVAASTVNAHLDHVTEAAPDEIFNTGIRFRADTDPRKMDLGVGAYRTDEGKPLVLNVIRKAEAIVGHDKSLNHEYLAIDGLPQFVTVARKLLFGADSIAIKQNRVATTQSLSGTGALRIGCEFIARHLPKGTTIYYSKPTWGNHNAIFNASGLPSKPHRYWDAKGRRLDIEGMLEDLKNAPDRSVVLLHACAHNPTGVDPTPEEWKRIAEVLKSKNHLPFFDSAYQGFASGDLEKDAWAIRYFVDQGFEMLAAQSFAKNFGLYNERIGSLSFVTKSEKAAKAVLSQIKLVVRQGYSNPPAYGARVIAAVLSDPALFAEWKVELKGMADRIIQMREALFNELKRLNTPGDWKHIITQIGMFSFTGLTPKQCEVLTTKHHVYLLSNGRISMCGITTKNVKYLAAAINDVVVNVKA